MLVGTLRNFLPDIQTFSSLQGAFLALSFHQEVVRKAQAELDVVVGPNRLPDFDDEDSLVYVKATVMEALRWHNVAPLGVAHSTIEDDELRGWFVPAGTVVVPNIWHVLSILFPPIVLY